ncbi:helix-turn-helix transcriptional regulator [Winogradskyella maritima]|uniref:Helix-turn-helix domain-containing protein n=1 Tax=Winogradskyella maritima TaxID=1517766 RepID=A0ABV8AGP2_9FLAO|nr:helix-turn-helix transcriptional regulator [Winogradskyella maritima]
MNELKHFKKVGDYHKIANLSPPEHPLISLVDYSEVKYPEDIDALKWKQDYYTIGLKRHIPYKMFYGQQEYDFDEGLMTFIAPNQVMGLGNNPNVKASSPSGWLLLVHPDFLWNTSLSESIKTFEFFDYSVSESLFLSEKEEQMMEDLLKNIQREYRANIDKFSQQIIVSQIELLLNYANRFYERQFITRQITNHGIVAKVEKLLTDYFANDDLMKKGLPSVSWVADSVNLSPNYLSSILKTVTGQSTQQHIHNALIEKAKLQLSTTALSISEIAYTLGFERPASFSKLFKTKTELSPLEFRKAFN